jgi:hypothetical protein
VVERISPVGVGRDPRPEHRLDRKPEDGVQVAEEVQVEQDRPHVQVRGPGRQVGPDEPGHQLLVGIGPELADRRGQPLLVFARHRDADLNAGRHQPAGRAGRCDRLERPPAGHAAAIPGIVEQFAEWEPDRDFVDPRPGHVAADRE